MIFSSIPFLFYFFPIFLILYYIVPFKLKNYILLFFSLVFYAWGEPIYILLMILICFINYLLGLMIEKYKKNKKIILIISILINLSVLILFKYSNFLIENINNIFNFNISKISLIMPIGISFYTFQIVSYLIDLYRGNIKAEKKFFDFVTYVSMFPQLIAGPIVRYETISKELKKREINFGNFSNGLFRFLTGLFKKILIANNIGLLFSVISNQNNISMCTAWLGLVAFALQIYFDFSGYSDMAIGMGKMLGFNYLENFNYPYIAKSITDFWNRWHISLSCWFKDYLYIPLGGNRKGTFRTIINLFIVWILTGIWHGANWNFILWGLYFFIILIIEKFLLKSILEKLPNIIRHIYSIFLILLGWLLFAFENTKTLLSYFKSLFLFNNNSFIDSNFLYYIKNYFVILFFGILLSTTFLKKVKITKITKLIIIILYILLFLICISFLVSDTYNPFLYFRF